MFWGSGVFRDGVAFLAVETFLLNCWTVESLNCWVISGHIQKR